MMQKEELQSLATRFELDACRLLARFYKELDQSRRMEGNPVGTALQYFTAAEQLRATAFRME
jgi:hypothetical protein